MVPITWQVNSFLAIFCMNFDRKEEEERETEQQQQTYQFTQGYNILHGLQVHRVTLTFIMHTNRAFSSRAWLIFITCCGNRVLYAESSN